MRKLIGTVFGFGLGMAAMWVAMTFHFVQTESDWFVIRKQEARFADCYVNISKWDAAEWNEHAAFKESLQKAGRGELIPQGLTEEFLFDTIRRLGDATSESSTRR